MRSQILILGRKLSYRGPSAPLKVSRYGFGFEQPIRGLKMSTPYFLILFLALRWYFWLVIGLDSDSRMSSLQSEPVLARLVNFEVFWFEPRFLVVIRSKNGRQEWKFQSISSSGKSKRPTYGFFSSIWKLMLGRLLSVSFIGPSGRKVWLLWPFLETIDDFQSCNFMRWV